MGDKVVLNPLGSPLNSSFTTQLNNDLDELADEFDNVVYRDGSQSMLGNLNMNSKRVYNLPDGISGGEPATIRQLETAELSGFTLSGLTTAATRAALSAIPGTNTTVLLRESGREGVFIYSNANLSATVLLDPNQGLVVPPLTDVTGASGAWVRQFTGPVVAEWFGVTGDGTTDDRAALQAALNTGRVVLLKKGTTYLIASGLTHVTGSGFVCLDGTATIKAKTGASGFNVTSSSAPRIGLDRNIFLCSGTDNVTLLGVHFTTDSANEIVLHGVRLYGGMGTEGYDIDVSFSGFFAGAMVAIGGTGAGRKRNIRVRSAVNSGITQGIARFTAGAQTTVVEIDNDKPSSTPSVPGRVVIDNIKNINFTGTALTDFANETDGVNIVHQGLNSAYDWDITVGTVDGIGEAIDVQGFRNRIRVGTIMNTHGDAIKVTHGARDNYIEVGTIYRSGRSSINLAGSDSGVTANHIQGNHIKIGAVVEPGAYGTGLTLPAGDVMVVLISNSASTWKAKNNVVEIGTITGDGTNCDYAVKDGGASTPLDNLVIIGKASGLAVASVSAPPANVRVRYGGRCHVDMTMNAAMSGVVSATPTKLTYDTVQEDTEGIAVPAANKITIKWPGIYRVTASVRLDGQAVGGNDSWTMSLYQGASAIRNEKGKINFGSKDETATISRSIYIDENDIGTANADLSVYFTHDVGSNRTISNATQFTRLNVERVA